MRLFGHGVENYLALVSVMVVANRLQNIPDYPEDRLKNDRCDFLRKREDLVHFRLYGWIVASWA